MRRRSGQQRRSGHQRRFGQQRRLGEQRRPGQLRTEAFEGLPMDWTSAEPRLRITLEIQSSRIQYCVIEWKETQTQVDRQDD